MKTRAPPWLTIPFSSPSCDALWKPDSGFRPGSELDVHGRRNGPEEVELGAAVD